MRFDCTTAAGLRDAIARTPRPLAMGRPRLLDSLPEDLTHRVLGFLRLTRDNAQRFLGIVQRTQSAAEDIGREFRRRLENGDIENPHLASHYLTSRQSLRDGLRTELCAFTEQIKEWRPPLCLQRLPPAFLEAAAIRSQPERAVLTRSAELGGHPSAARRALG